MSTDGTFSVLWNSSFDWFGFKTIVSHSTYHTLAPVIKLCILKKHIYTLYYFIYLIKKERLPIILNILALYF